MPGEEWAAVVGKVIENNNQTYQDGTTTTQKKLSQEGINKIIYDVLSSDQGLAALAGAENSSGGYKSSTKSLLSQDLIAKLVGEIANVTAPTVQEVSNSNVKRSAIGEGILPGANRGGAGGGTVICTELLRQDLLDIDLYSAGFAHFNSLPLQTIRGYQLWAMKVVPLMRKYPRLARLLAPIARGRYEYIVHRKLTLSGLITVYIGQPICYLLGYFVRPPAESVTSSVVSQ